MTTLDTDSETGQLTSANKPYNYLEGLPYNYLDDLKSKLSPEHYATLMKPLKYSAKSRHKGEVQDYQAQLLMPIDIKEAGFPQQLAFTPAKKEMRYGGWDSPDYEVDVQPQVITEGVTAQGYDTDSGTVTTGYRSSKPTNVNGVPVFAEYDMTGKLTRYVGDPKKTTWLNKKQYLTGNWDANGMPKPKSHTSSGGGIRGFVNDIMSDPILGTIANIAASYFGGPIGVAALGAVQGKSPEEIAKAAAISYVAGQAAEGVSAGLSPELAELVKSGDLTAAQAASLAKAAGNVASTVVRGADPLQALISGGIGVGTAALTAEIPGFADMNKYQQQAVNKAILNTLQGKDPSQGLINEAIASGISAARSYSSSPSEELVEQTTKSESAPVYDYGDSSSTPSSNLVEQTIPQQKDAVVAEAPVYEDFDYAPQNSTSDGVASSTELMGNLQDKSSGTTTTDLAVADANDQYYDNSGVGPITSNYTDASGQEFTSSGTPIYDNAGTGVVTTNYFDAFGNEFAPDGTPIYDNDPRSSSSSKGPDFEAMARQLLAAGTSSSSRGGAAALGAAALGASLFDDQNEDGLVYTAEPVQNQSVSYNPQVGILRDGAAYGLDQLGATYTTNAAQGGIMSLARGGITNYPAAKMDGNEFVLAAQKHGIPSDINTLNKIVALVNQGMSPDDAAQKIAGGTNTIGMAYGGQVTGLGGYAAGGNPRLLRGPGDGMSDNIPATIAGKQPARLADGEFVVPADVVSHLGNGSTEAGANVLYQMMERVRKARTGNSKQGKQINPQKFVPRKGK
jgi:hypothetical protein